MLGVARRTIHYWVEAYAQERHPEALRDAERLGRPSLWTEEAQALLQELLASSPDRWGYLALNWTVPLLQEQLYQGAGIWFSDDTIRRELHRLRYVWKRPRYVLEPDPEREKKTPDPPQNPAFAAARRGPGGG
jgi:transposase